MPRQTKNSKKGFTLLEIVAVIALILILTSVSVILVGTVLDKAKILRILNPSTC